MSEKERILKKAIALNEDKKHKEVDDLLTTVILEQYNDAALYAEKAIALFRLKKQDECERIANIGYQLDPNNAKINNYLGHIYSEKKEYEKSENYYKKAIEKDSNYANAYNGLGSLYHDKKEYQKAEENYIKATEKDLNNSMAYHNLGVLYYDIKEYEKAEVNYIEVTKKNPNYSMAYNDLGVFYYDQNEYGKAEKNYEIAIEKDSNNSIAYNNLGALYYDQGEYKKAEEKYKIAIEKDSNYSSPYYNFGRLYFNTGKYEEAKKNYNIYIKIENDENDYYSKLALSRIEEIDKILESPSYEIIANLIGQIKELLLFKGDNITHYTGISTAQILVLDKSPIRLSEGSFLNDTSEGEELFKFLDYFLTTNKNSNEILFTKRPFIGSFVDDEKNNDLALWRMYGKEALEEAKGCSITIDALELKIAIKNKVKPNSESSKTGNDDIEFYRVAYRNENKFEFAGATTTINEKLTQLMNDLKEEIKKFDKEKVNEVKIIELLNTIAYLFKSVEYKYENEVRLVINEAIGFDRMIDFDKDNFKPSVNPNKVYIELVSIAPLLKTITIGPKVAKAEEWAATFHYHLVNNNYKAEIFISKIPFK